MPHKCLTRFNFFILKLYRNAFCFVADDFLSIPYTMSFQFKFSSRKSFSTVSNYCGKKLPIRKRVRMVASIENRNNIECSSIKQKKSIQQNTSKLSYNIIFISTWQNFPLHIYLEKSGKKIRNVYRIKFDKKMKEQKKHSTIAKLIFSI